MSKARGKLTPAGRKLLVERITKLGYPVAPGGGDAGGVAVVCVSVATPLAGGGVSGSTLRRTFECYRLLVGTGQTHHYGPTTLPDALKFNLCRDG